MNTKSTVSLNLKSSLVSKWDNFQSQNKKRLKKKIAKNPQNNVDYFDCIDGDYYVRAFGWGEEIREYIPRLNFRSLRPNSPSTLNIFKQILIWKGCHEVDYRGIIVNYSNENFYKETLWYINDKEVTIEKILAFFETNNGQFFFVTEDDYIDFVSKEDTAFLPPLANTILHIGEVYATCDNELFIITRKTARQMHFEFIAVEGENKLDVPIILLNYPDTGIITEFKYKKPGGRLVLNINGDWNFRGCQILDHKIRARELNYPKC
ncbi:MAG: hypothetical protein WC716_04450 [Chitinophagaceae bacterium]|jgi:hypothetical protein